MKAKTVPGPRKFMAAFGDCNYEPGYQVPVMGYRLELVPWLQTFIYRNVHSRSVSVCEIQTGRALAMDEEFREATCQAAEILEYRGKQVVLNIVKDCLRDYPIKRRKRWRV